MKIALILDASQQKWHDLYLKILTEEAALKGHSVADYGIVPSFAHTALLAALVFNTGAADYIMTGDERGMVNTMALSGMPNLRCGLALDQLDAFMFAKINAGNCLSLALDKADADKLAVYLRQVLHKLFEVEWASGYPESLAAFNNKNRGILIDMKKTVGNDAAWIAGHADGRLIKETFADERTRALFYSDCKDEEVVSRIKAAV